MITSTQMQELEDYAELQGVTTGQLMENAGRKVVEVMEDKLDLDGKHIIIFAGAGNNAGDGFVVARYLAEKHPVVVLFFSNEESLNKDAGDNYYKILKKVNVFKIETEEDLAKFRLQSYLKYVFVDAMLGTGIKGLLRNPISFAVDFFNSLKGEKVAVDLPSGLDPDTGEVHEKCCTADLIVCLHDIKAGILNSEELTERTVIVDIGIPKKDDVNIEKALL